MLILDDLDRDFVLCNKSVIDKIDTITSTLPKNVVALYLSSFCSLPTIEQIVISKLWKQIIPSGYDLPVVVYKYSPYAEFITSDFMKMTDNADFVTIDAPYAKVYASEWSIPFRYILFIAVYNERSLLECLSAVIRQLKQNPMCVNGAYNVISFKMKMLDNTLSINSMIGKKPENANITYPYFYMWDNAMKSILAHDVEKTASAIFFMTHMSLIKYQTYLDLITDEQFKYDVMDKIKQIRNQSMNGLAITPPIKTKVVEPNYRPHSEKYRQAIASLGANSDFSENEIIGVMNTKGIERVDADYEGTEFIRTVIYNGDRYGLCKKDGKIYGISSDGNTVLNIDIPNQHKYEFVNQLAEMIPSGYEAYSADNNDSKIIQSIWDTNLI